MEDLLGLSQISFTWVKFGRIHTYNICMFSFYMDQIGIIANKNSNSKWTVFYFILESLLLICLYMYMYSVVTNRACIASKLETIWSKQHIHHCEQYEVFHDFTQFQVFSQSKSNLLFKVIGIISLLMRLI